MTVPGTAGDFCPRCEEGILVTVEGSQEVSFEGLQVTVPGVQMEECPRCGLRSTSGREVALFDVLFSRQFASVQALVQALKDAGFAGMFLREDRPDSILAFGSREYAASLAGDLRDLYLDNESSHVIVGLSQVSRGLVPVELGSSRYTVRLPKIGEGENGVVYDYEEAQGSVLKLAKPRRYSRDHIREECEVTAFFASHGIPVPGIVEYDPHGSYVIKERLAGESLAVLYDALGPPGTPRHQRVRTAVARFAEGLIELFERHPEAKTSISPNNIFVLEEGDLCRCLLVDTGPAPLHDYSRFDFAEYWDKVVPEKIQRYRAVGYI